jgi:hypothetical protein
MAGRAAGLIVVVDASTFVSAALKANSLPERVLLRAVDPPNRLILSQAVEDEYREVIFGPRCPPCFQCIRGAGFAFCPQQTILRSADRMASQRCSAWSRGDTVTTGALRLIR